MGIKMSTIINSKIQKEIIEHFEVREYEVLEINDPIPQDDIDHAIVKIRAEGKYEHLVDVEINNDSGKWEIVGFVNTE